MGVAMNSLAPAQYALVNPDDRIADGLRIIGINDQTFPVASPMFWVECPDGIDKGTHCFDPEAQAFRVKPAETAPPTKQGGPNVIA